MKKKKYFCPICKNELVEIIYGMPIDMSLIKKSQKKKVYLGGCMISFNNPEYHCYHCDENFHKKDVEKNI